MGAVCFGFGCSFNLRNVTNVMFANRSFTIQSYRIIQDLSVVVNVTLIKGGSHTGTHLAACCVNACPNIASKFFRFYRNVHKKQKKSSTQATHIRWHWVSHLMKFIDDAYDEFLTK